jgi:hypothetical protein
MIDLKKPGTKKSKLLLTSMASLNRNKQDTQITPDCT